MPPFIMRRPALSKKDSDCSNKAPSNKSKPCSPPTPTSSKSSPLPTNSTIATGVCTTGCPRSVLTCRSWPAPPASASPGAKMCRTSVDRREIVLILADERRLDAVRGAVRGQATRHVDDARADAGGANVGVFHLAGAAVHVVPRCRAAGFVFTAEWLSSVSGLSRLEADERVQVDEGVKK